MKKLTLFFNPFERYSTERLLTVGSITLIIGSLLGYLFKGHFDGALDLHFFHSITLSQAFLGNIVSMLCMFIVLTVAGKLIYSKTRWIDVLSVSLIARLPLYLATLTNINNINYELGEALMTSITSPERNIPTDAVLLSAGLGFIMILFAIWMLTLLFNGFKLATNGKGAKLIFSFIIAIIVAEALSKGLLYVIY